MAETEVGEDPEIKWGKKAGTGGKGKTTQFYESFIYENVEYAKYDNVYLFKNEEPEPFVGKLLKMWETRDKQKKGKVLWFFQREEISNFFGNDDDVLENEIFLASGEASGLANINPLEAIAGKCNVVCISKDDKNRQPTDEEVQNADFVFRRTFDVGCCKIKDEIEGKIAGTDVKFLLNKDGSGCTTKVESGTEEVIENAYAYQNGSIAPKCPEIVITNGHCGNMPANEDNVLNASSAKPESSTREKTVAEACVEPDSTEKTNESDKKALVESKVKPKDIEDKDGKALVKRVESKGKGKHAKDTDELEENRQSKKAKRISENVDKCKNVLRQPSSSPDANAAEALEPTASDFDHEEEVKTCKASPSTMEGPSKKLKSDNKAKLSLGKSLKTSSQECHDGVPKIEAQELAITSKLNLKPEADKSKWFRDRPWEDELQDSHEQGKLVLLQNLDPSYTSDEVKDIITRAFKENCKVKMIQRTAFSSPLSGQAFVLFTSRDVAQMVVKKLDEGCLLLSNGRPLVASPGTICFPEKKLPFYGHFTIDKLKYKCQTLRDQKDAVSTSHCSQPNTIEYDMATEWCLLQQRSEARLKKLYEKQQEEFRKLKARLKANK